MGKTGDTDEMTRMKEKMGEQMELLQKLDMEVKAKERLLVKVQWSKGELRETIGEKDGAIRDMEEKVRALERENRRLEEVASEKVRVAGEKEKALEGKKQEYYKLQGEFQRKCDAYDTLKAVAKEIQRKNEEMEKELWMGFGGIGKGGRDHDPIGAEVNIDTFVFGNTNPYALSNNTKLSLILKGKDLRSAISGLETTLVN